MHHAIGGLRYSDACYVNSCSTYHPIITSKSVDPSVLVKHQLYRRPLAARGYRRRADQQRPTQRVPGGLDVSRINLTTFLHVALANHRRIQLALTLVE